MKIRRNKQIKQNQEESKAERTKERTKTKRTRA
jgi:hypothetical protein